MAMIDEQRLLVLLLDDGRATMKHVADELGVTEGAVRKKVKVLTRNGIINGYKAVIDWEAFGLRKQRGKK